MNARIVLTGAAFVAALFVVSAQAQQPQRVRGTIESADGASITVKQAEGPDLTVKLADNVQVFGVVPAKLGDIKAGDYVGVGAMAQPDGSQKAIQVMIFAESQRGTGEGFRPWDRPGTTMTNGTVDTTAASVDGQTLTVKYKDGQQKILVGSGCDDPRLCGRRQNRAEAGRAYRHRARRQGRRRHAVDGPRQCRPQWRRAAVMDC